MRVNYSFHFREVFDLYLRVRLHFAFERICFDLGQSRIDPGLPILLVSNHVSWWDGFFISETQRRLLPLVPHYTVMLERELRKYPWLKRLGAIGIDPERPTSVAETFLSLRTVRRSTSCFSVALFPQGQITPQQFRPLGFKKGMEALIRNLHPIQLIPVALHIEPLANPRPTAFIRSGQVIRSDSQQISAELLEDAIQVLLEQTCIQEPLRRLGLVKESEVRAEWSR